ncbi:MAG: hypothetical protein R1F52_03435 [Candidatus Nitrosoabyssus spongiisocia]|nr:MAG: hypothetical protein R1F52_03435 [Nitrosopumilaceae archaeon AB1(1)]
MSHLDVDVFDFLLIALYPGAGLLIIELISRAVKIPNWIKLSIQGIAMLGFAVAYVTLITAHWLTSLVLAALAISLFYQARRMRIFPNKTELY